MQAAFLDQFDRDHLPREAADRWRVGGGIEHIQDSENFVYRVTKAAQVRFLRLTHAGHRPIEAELHFIEHLARKAIPVARPMAAADGSFVQSLCNPTATFHACMFTEVPGRRFGIQSIDGDDVDTIRRWGRLLGTIHAAATTYHPRGVRRSRWDEDDVWAKAETYLPETEANALRERCAVREWLTTRNENAADFGLVHGDLCMANFHVDGSALTAFDFDDSCYHWFVYDIICALSPHIGRPFYVGFTVAGLSWA